jgi:hypothetical protein
LNRARPIPRRCRRLAGALGLIILFASPIATAQNGAPGDGTVCIIVGKDDGMPMALRVASELADMGIAVQTFPPGSLDDADAPLDAIAEKISTAAIIRVGGDDRLEVWTARGTFAEAVPSASADGGDRMLAIAAAELIRARLLREAPPTGAAAQDPQASNGISAPTADVPPPPAVPGNATAARPAVALDAAPGSGRARSAGPRLTAEVGPAVLAAGVSMAPTMNVFIGAALALFGPLSVEVLGLTPLVPASTSSSAGELQVHTALVGGALRLGWAFARGRFHAYAAPGFAAMFLLFTADSVPGYDARDDTTAASVALLRLGASLSLSSRLRLDLGLFVGVALSEVLVRLDRRVAARFGRPVLAGSLNLEVVLW